MPAAPRKLALRRETLAPMESEPGLVRAVLPPRAGVSAGLRASSGACLRAGAYSVASAATAISSYLLTRGC